MENYIYFEHVSRMHINYGILALFWKYFTIQCERCHDYKYALHFITSVFTKMCRLTSIGGGFFFH